MEYDIRDLRSVGVAPGSARWRQAMRRQNCIIRAGWESRRRGNRFRGRSGTSGRSGIVNVGQQQFRLRRGREPGVPRDRPRLSKIFLGTIPLERLSEKAYLPLVARIEAVGGPAPPKNQQGLACHGRTRALGKRAACVVAIQNSTEEFGSDASLTGVVARVCDTVSYPLRKMAFFPQRDKQAALFGGVVSVHPDEAAQDEDAALLRRCRAGDMDAYGVLVARHERRIQAIVGRIVLGGADNRKPACLDLEDLVQDVFVQAWRALPRFRGDARFSTWLYRIATNRALKEWKRMRAEAARIHETPLEDHVDIEASASLPYAHLESPQHAFDIRMRDAAMRQAIDTLPEKQRTVILLHYYEDYSCEDIALMLECSVGTVWSRLHYGVKRLRDSLNWLDAQEKSAP